MIRLPAGKTTPSPWCNILTNPDFGCIVSEQGFASTWALNSGENRLTGWSNDAVSDPASEVIYVRDEQTGAFWSLTPGPKPAETTYEIRHAVGSSTWRHKSNGLYQSMKVSVHPTEALKNIEIKIRNLWPITRRLTLTYQAGWIMGDIRPSNQRYIDSFFDVETQSLIVQNYWNTEYKDQAAFIVSTEPVHGFTCDEMEFFGTGDKKNPAALSRWGLNSLPGQHGNIAVLQIHLTIPPDSENTIHFCMGWGKNIVEAKNLIAKFRGKSFFNEYDEILKNFWDGQWYQRAFFDDGTIIGSVGSEEASIDSISQSWAVISGFADGNHAKHALYSAFNSLVDIQAGLVRLLWPPFNKGKSNPGYIKGYPPGIRENAAQYTHAAAWLMRAFAEAGQTDRAWQLLKMLNPIEHTKTEADALNYGGEPYVLAGDVYSIEPHQGQAGWTWYTGSAAWYWRTSLESMLGIKIQWPRLKIEPVIPQNWDGFSVRMRIKNLLLNIEVKNPRKSYDGVVEVQLNEKNTDIIDLAVLSEKNQPVNIKVILGFISQTDNKIKTPVEQS